MIEREGERKRNWRVTMELKRRRERNDKNKLFKKKMKEGEAEMRKGNKLCTRPQAEMPL